MSRPRNRTLALVLVVELLVGAFIWFSSSPSAAQPATASVPTATAPAPTATAPAPGDAPAEAKATQSAEPKRCKPHKPSPKKPLIDDLLPIGILIIVITVVLLRLPKVELGHSRHSATAGCSTGCRSA